MQKLRQLIPIPGMRPPAFRERKPNCARASGSGRSPPDDQNADSGREPDVGFDRSAARV
jgi:hypothetical protein